MNAMTGSIVSCSDCRSPFYVKEDPLDRLVAKIKAAVSDILMGAASVATLAFVIVGRATLLCVEVALLTAAVYVAIELAAIAACVSLVALPAIIVLYIFPSL